MFVIPVKYNGIDFIEKLVKSIRDSGNTDSILIVDSDSSDKSYFDRLKPFSVLIADIQNKHYVDGAIWYAYEKYPEEEFFFMLHDSILVNENLSFLKDKDCTCLAWFDVQYQGPEGANDSSLYGYCIDKIMSCGIYPTEKEMTSFPALFGPIIFCKREILTKLKNLGLNKILPTNKREQTSAERLWGFFLKRIGVDLKENSLLGDNVESKKSNAIVKLGGGRK